MRFDVLKFLALGVLFCTTLEVNGRQTKESDKVAEIVTNFYQWYFDLIENKRMDRLYPSFTKTSDGMTTLDFTTYRRELLKHSFDSVFVEESVKGYDICSTNLKKIPYETFLTLQDLDDFESIECAFSNKYEWIPGMEPFAGFKVLQPYFVNNSSATIKVVFIDAGEKEPKSSAIISVINDGNRWLINKIEF